jgi:tRNA A-37 threonylcarbamoyl transferase component Bud32
MIGAPTTAEALRRSGRQPPAPFSVELDDGRRLTLHRLLRTLPGKRLTGVGELDGHPVLAKLFIAARGSERHWRQERRGLEALLMQDIATPRLLAAGSLKGGGHYLLTEFLEGAQALTVPSPLPPAGEEKGEWAAVLQRLTLVFETLGRLHARGLSQDDPHLGNFLLHGGRLLVIDGEAIRQAQSGRPLAEADAVKNLSLLLAQLPSAQMEEALPVLLAAYRTGHPAMAGDPRRLRREIALARQWRLRKALDKCLRDCSRFKVDRRHDRFVAVLREEAECLAPLIADPDLWLEAGTPLKLGRTSTLALVEHAGRRLVIKRYNIKSAGHALARFWRPSRAWHSWIEGHRLRFLGIATPRPLALIERRLGPLRGRAWLVMEYCEGPSLQQTLAAHTDGGAPSGVMEAVRRLFAAFAAERISHGDLKASNFLCRGDELVVLDLDAMRQHDSAAAWRKAWATDRARFLRNWPAGSALQREMDAALPPG